MITRKFGIKANDKLRGTSPYSAFCVHDYMYSSCAQEKSQKMWKTKGI